MDKGEYYIKLGNKKIFADRTIELFEDKIFRDLINKR